MDSGTPNSQVRATWGRSALRVGGTAIAAAVLLGLTPAVADAAPRRPSDGEIAAAQSQADAVGARIGELSGRLASAQAGVESARTDALIALDEYQATEDAAAAARERAEAAADEAARKTEELGIARDDVVAFARRSYMQGSTNPGASALLTAGDPSQLIERAALLEAAGSYRTDVLGTVTVLQQQATAAEVVARTAVVEADELQQQAAQQLEVATAAEQSARAQQAAVRTERAAVQAELDVAQQQLTSLVGARAAAERAAAEEAAAQRAAQQRVVAAPVVPRPAPAATVNRPAPAPVPAPAPAPAAVAVTVPVPERPAPQTNAGPGSASAAQTAIAAARRYIGTPYAWGGGGRRGPGPGQDPDVGVIGFDCSGLTQYAYGQAGISIPRNSRDQYATSPKVARGSLQPGDLVFWATDPSRPSTIHHVAIYLGGDRIIEAPESGKSVRETGMRWGGYIGAVRPSA